MVRPPEELQTDKLKPFFNAAISLFKNDDEYAINCMKEMFSVVTGFDDIRDEAGSSEDEDLFALDDEDSARMSIQQAIDTARTTMSKTD